MQVLHRDASPGRKVLIGMVVDKSVLAAISAKWEGNLFNTRWENIVGSLCVDYYKKYRDAPGRQIEHLVDQWAESGKDRETVSLLDRFLSDLSGEYVSSAENSNSQLILDIAATYFNRTKLSDFHKQLKGCLETNDLEGAEKLIREYRRIEVGKGAGINVFADQEVVVQAFAEKREPLIQYPGALGNFFGQALERDAFIAFMGKEKVGKTWWLLDVAWRAVQQGRKVAIFEVGDMSQHQLIRRLAVRATLQPMKAGRIMVPEEMEPGDPPVIHRKEQEWANDLTDSQVIRAFDRLRDEYGEHCLRLSVHPNSSINVHGIHSIIDGWVKNDDWVPDVPVIDYADIIAPISGLTDSRSQIDYTWKHLRAISQDIHCCLVTATQSNKASYNSITVDRSNITDDKRKLAHVTGMVGINQQGEEQSEGMYRLNWVVLRELEFSEEQCVYVAGCLALGNPAMLSSF